jgi:hypothetical protein
MSDHDQGSQGPSNLALERLGVFVGEWNIEITSMSFQRIKLPWCTGTLHSTG